MAGETPPGWRAWLIFERHSRPNDPDNYWPHGYTESGVYYGTREAAEEYAKANAIRGNVREVFLAPETEAIRATRAKRVRDAMQALED